MADETKTVRAFISSTFRDMHAERDHLITVVFPELRERLERLGLDFYDVDLRWGVPAAGVDGETANSWAYCKQWIDRVEPFFVCVLGQRYGWTPPANQLVDPRERSAWAGMSITEMEVRHAVLSGRLRRRSFFYFRRTEVPPAAAPEVYREFVDQETRVARLKEEILDRSARPVRIYDCAWTGSGFDDLDQFGRLVLEDLWSGVLRDQRYVTLEVWRQVLGHDPLADPVFTDEFHPIPENVWERVVESARPVPSDPLDREAAAMRAFGASRSRWFQGRQHELERLVRFVEDERPDDAPTLMVIRAVAGQGKSALMARLAEQLADSSHFVITHFVGATERSTELRWLLERVNRELDRHQIAPPPQDDDGKQDLESLKRRLRRRLESYWGDRRVVLLIDGVNQLDYADDLSGLPHQPGSAVRVVLSCIDEGSNARDARDINVLAALSRLSPTPEWLHLKPLDEAAVRRIVVDYLLEYCKELDADQIDDICRMEQAKNPLYLMVMLGELRTLGGNDLNRVVPRLIAEMQARYPDAVSLFGWVLERMEVFGVEAVTHWSGYLALARQGLSSRELSELLSRKLGRDAGRTALLIERGMRRFLLRRGTRLDFFHGQLRQAVLGRYATRTAQTMHNDLADYLGSKWRDGDAHATSELPYHLGEGRSWDALHAALNDAEFRRAKTELFTSQGLMEDGRLAVRAACATSAAGEAFQIARFAMLFDQLRESLPGPARAALQLAQQRDYAGCLRLIRSERNPRLRLLIALGAAWHALITGDRQQAVELIRQVQDSAVEGIDRTTRGTALVAVRALARRGIAEISDLLVGDAMLERFVEAERKYLTDPPAAELRARIIDQIEQVATHATDRSKLRRQMAAIYHAAGDAGQAQRLLASALDDAREVEDVYRKARCLAELAACNLSLDDIESEIAGLPESQWRLCALAELASVLFDKGETERGESLIKDALIPWYSAWKQREGSGQGEQDSDAGKMRLLEMLFSDSKWLAESLARLAAAVASHQWSGSDALADWAEQAALESASREQTGAFRGVQPFIDVARRYLDRGLKNRALTPLQAAWDRAGALEELSSASGVGQVTELALLLKESGDTSLVDRLPPLLRDLAEQSPDFYVLTVVAKALAGIGDHDGALRFFWRALDEALAAEPEERARRLAEISRRLGDSLTLEQATSLYARLREEAELLTSRTRLACYTVLPDLAGAFHKNGDHDACQALLQKALVEASRPDETSSYPLQSVVETLERYYEPDHGPSMLIELGDAIARSVFEARDAPSHKDVGDMLEYLSFLGEYGGDEPSPLAGLYGAVGERLARAAESPERGRLLSDLEDRIVARDSRVDAVHFFTCVGRGAACAGRGETARRAFTLAALSASGGFLTLTDELGRACLQAGDGGWARPVYDELVSRIGKHPQPSTCREIARAAAGLRRIGFRWTALKMALRALRATKACKDDEQLHGQLIHVARDLHEAVGGWASRRLLNKAERFFVRRPDDRKKFEYLTEVMDGWLATGRKDRAEALGDKMKGSLLSNPTLLPAKTYASTIVVGDLTGARSGWLEEMLEEFSADPFGGFHLEVSKLIDGLISTVGDLVDPALRVEKLLVIAGRLPSIIPDPTFRQPLETRLYRSLARSDGNRLLEVLRRLEPPDTRLAVVKAAADEIGSQPGRAGKWEVILALLIEALGARYAMYPVLGSVIRLASDDQVEAVAQIVLS